MTDGVKARNDADLARDEAATLRFRAFLSSFFFLAGRRPTPGRKRTNFLGKFPGLAYPSARGPLVSGLRVTVWEIGVARRCEKARTDADLARDEAASLRCRAFSFFFSPFPSSACLLRGGCVVGCTRKHSHTGSVTMRSANR